LSTTVNISFGTAFVAGRIAFPTRQPEILLYELCCVEPHPASCFDHIALEIELFSFN